VLCAIARAMTISGFVGFTVNGAMSLPTADAAELADRPHTERFGFLTRQGDSGFTFLSSNINGRRDSTALRQHHKVGGELQALSPIRKCDLRLPALPALGT
jgi:hypothetical protein